MDSAGLTGGTLDAGFRALKIDTSGTTAVLRTAEETEQPDLALFTESLKTDRTGDDLLFQVMLDWGLDLSLPIADESLEGSNVFSIAEDSLLACFDGLVTDAVVRAMAVRRPLRAVFKDSGFTSDAVCINAEQIFREMSPETEVRAI